MGGAGSGARTAFLCASAGSGSGSRLYVDFLQVLKDFTRDRTGTTDPYSHILTLGTEPSTFDGPVTRLVVRLGYTGIADVQAVIRYGRIWSKRG